MKDNEIIKALECCGENFSCAECECYPRYCNGNSTLRVRDALNLISRQKAEIERYEKEHQENFDKWKMLADKTKNNYEELYQEAKAIIKAEAVKEFAERLKDDLELNDDDGWFEITEHSLVCAIDNLVKEMVGEENGNTEENH